MYGGRRKKALTVHGPRLTVGVKVERQMLHAWKLGFFHPRTDNWMECEAPPPVDLMSSFHSVPIQTRQRTSAS